MKKYLVFIILFFYQAQMFAQVNAGEDMRISEGLPVTLSGIYEGYVGLPVTGQDDYFVGPFDIGFNFEYFGEVQTQFAVSPNGLVSFDIPDILDVVEWEEAPIPNNIFKKTIMGPYQDLFKRPIEPHSKFIYYRTVGQEPDRRLIVGWCEAPMFQCEDLQVTTQIVLYENSNNIANHIINKPPCDLSHDNRATHGLNFNDALGEVVQGRNNSSWTAYNESWLFEPNGTDSYTISQIDFVPEVIIPQGKIEWTWFGNSYPGGEIISNERNVLVSPKETTTYFCEITLCSGLTYVDEMTIVTIPIPNAFNPGSPVEQNRIFKVFANPDENVSKYALYIYNRWGQEVFSTNDINEGWDGTINGDPCNPGVYIWTLYYEEEGETLTNKGTVMIVK